MTGTDQVPLEAGVVDLVHRVLQVGEEERGLTTKEAELLRYLAAHPGRPIPREELLTQVWGYRAGVHSRTADTTVQRLRGKIELDPARPRHLLTEHGVGYRFEPLARPGPPLPPPAAPRPARSGTNLTPDPGSFLGRSRETAALREALLSARVVTVVGAGGTGKTRLARELGRALAAEGEFPGGVWFCDLTESRNAAHVLRVTGKVLDVPLSEGEGLRDPVERLGRDLRARGRTLLIVDNAEQVVEAVAPVFARWVEALPETRFLITSRERLRIGPERVFELEPLDPEAAAAMFLDRAEAARPGFQPDDPVRRTVAEIVARLDHLPLAVELVAPRVGVLPPDAILSRLDDRFRLASARRRDLPARQRTLRAALDWSWDLLDEAERTTLAGCSVFRGGFRSEDAERVVALDPALGWVPELLQALVDKSLLRGFEVPDLPGEPRLGMLESVREYAAERLEESGRAQDARRRHRDAALARGEAERAAIEGDDGLRAAERLAVETDNLAAALESADDAETVGRATLLLSEVLSVRGPADHHRALLDAAVERVGPELPQLRLELLIARARDERRRGDFEGALRDALEAERVAAGLPAAAQVEALFARGLALHFGGRVEEAIEVYREAADRFDALGSAHGSVRARPVLAFALWQLGRRAEASPMLRDSLSALDDGALRLYGARNMARLGLILGARGRWEEALELVRERSLGGALFGTRRGESLVLANLAALESAAGRLEEAVAHSEEALRRHPPGRDPTVRAVILRNLGLLEADRGDHGRARELLHESLALHRAHGDPLGCARVWTDLGELALLTGSPEEAEDAYRRARAAAEDAGDQRQVAIARACGAVVDHAHGRPDRATTEMDAALRQLGETAGARLQGTFLALAGAMDADRGSVQRGEQRLEAAAEALRELGDRTADGTLRLCRAVLDLARARSGHPDAALLRARADQALASLAGDHSAHELAVPRLLFEQARTR